MEYLNYLKRLWCWYVEVGIRHARLVSGLFFILMVYVFAANIAVFSLRGGPIDNALALGDPYRGWQEAACRQKGLNCNEAIPILIDLPRPVSVESLWKVINLTNRLSAIPDVDVMSLVTIPEFRAVQDSNSSIRIDAVSYITEELLRMFDTEKWRALLESDPSVWGTLIGRNLEWTAVTIIPHRSDYDENKLSWAIASILEEREIAWWEWAFWKTDIYPKDPAVRVIGLAVGRWTIDRALNFDLVNLPLAGVMLSFPFMWWYLGSRRQALIAIVVNILSAILITRAMIVYWHWLWPEAAERVYSLLAYANCIVQGGSLSLHRIIKFRETEENLLSEERWIQSSHHISPTLVAIAAMGLGPFLFAIRSLSVWQMIELGIFAATGVAVIVFLLVIVVTPAIYTILDGLFGKEPEVARVWRPRVRQTPVLMRLQIPWQVGVPCSIALFCMAAFLYQTDMLTARTQPLNYITGTLVEQSARKQEMLGYGNDLLPLLVRGNKSFNWHFPVAFMQDVFRLESEFRDGLFEQWQKEQYATVHPIFATGSAIGKFPQIAKGLWEIPFPATDADVDEVFFWMEGGINKGIRQALWGADAVIVRLYINTNDSVAFRELIERIRAYAAEKYPSLEVTPLGKGVAFPRVDQLIANGTGWNIVSSYALLLPFYMVFIFFMNKHGKEGRYTLQLFPAACVIALSFVASTGVLGIGMWIFGVPISMSSAPIGELAVNAANDFGLFIVAAYAACLRIGYEPTDAMRRALVLEGMVVLMDCALNCLAFVPLWISRFSPVREVGIMMVGMLLVCAGTSLLVVPDALLFVTRKNTRKETKDNEPVSFVGSRTFSIS